MLREYQKRIINFLNETTGPVDVEKIRINCGIGNWNTALKHCLQLLIQGKIKGEETSKGWLFWIHQPTHLQPWEEAVGDFTDLRINEESITLVLTTQKTLHITFPTNTPEAQTILKTLKNTPKGKKIAILCTDIPEKPILIQPLERNDSSHKKIFMATAISLKRVLVLTKCFVR
jgi:hypothetical protein